jgi:hypothetical protein
MRRWEEQYDHRLAEMELQREAASPHPSKHWSVNWVRHLIRRIVR